MEGNNPMPRGSVRFCLNCGSPLEVGEIDHRLRSFCLHCGRIHYEQLKVGAGAIIEQDGCLLLIKRTQEPFAAHWNLPAGYVEVDESPAQAVVREVYEETGLRVEVSALESVYFADDDSRGNLILIVYRCQVLAGTLAATAEGVDPTYFQPDQVPALLTGGGHNQAILAWQAARLRCRAIHAFRHGCP